MKYLSFLFMLSCAQLYHAQQSDIIRVQGKKLKPFEVKISETAVDLQQAGDLTSAVTKDNDRAKQIADILALFQMGPRTGTPIYNEKYADKIAELLYKKCPSRKITGLLSVRERREYPVVSGEIIKIRGYCIQ